MTQLESQPRKVLHILNGAGGGAALSTLGLIEAFRKQGIAACAVCHEVGGAPLFGSRPSLALNSNLHSAHPDNLVQVILHGIAAPASSDLGYMPAFKDSFTDGQVAELVSYLRRQFAPDKPAWTDIHATISRIRQEIAR